MTQENPNQIGKVIEIIGLIAVVGLILYLIGQRFYCNEYVVINVNGQDVQAERITQMEYNIRMERVKNTIAKAPNYTKGGLLLWQTNQT